MKIPITKPFFDEEETEMITRPLETGWVVQGPYVKEFENMIARYAGVKHAIAVNSCTSGQFIMSRVIGLQPGDEVIVPAFTWISTANSVEFLGAKAVFCDIDLETFNIDTKVIEKLLTPRTKALYPVHLFGLGADMAGVMRVAQREGLKVVEDCACALGTWIGDKHAGTFGSGGILSFHPRKSITTGEGGMILTDEPHVAKMAASLRDHGALKTDYARHNEKGGFLLTEYASLGYNMRLTDIQGAMGVAQAKKIPFILKRKHELAQIYRERLKEIRWLKAPHVPSGFTHGYQAYCAIFRPEEAFEAVRRKDLEAIDRLSEERNAIMARLEEAGISTRQGTHAVHIQEFYHRKYGFKPMDFPASYAADRLTVALPFYPSITGDEIDYLFDHLKAIKAK